MNIFCLDLLSNEWITDIGIEHLVKNCRKLRKLYLQFCTQLTNQSLLNIQNYLTELVVLDVFGWNSLTLNDLQSFLQTSTILQSLKEFNVPRTHFENLKEWREKNLNFQSSLLIDSSTSDIDY